MHLDIIYCSIKYTFIEHIISAQRSDNKRQPCSLASNNMKNPTHFNDIYNMISSERCSVFDPEQNGKLFIIDIFN